MILVVKPFQITQIKTKPALNENKITVGFFEKHSKYDVLAIDEEFFLVIDDKMNFVWISDYDCKGVK